VKPALEKNPTCFEPKQGNKINTIKVQTDIKPIILRKEIHMAL